MAYRIACTGLLLSMLSGCTIYVSSGPSGASSPSGPVYVQQPGGAVVRTPAHPVASRPPAAAPGPTTSPFPVRTFPGQSGTVVRPVGTPTTTTPPATGRPITPTPVVVRPPTTGTPVIVLPPATTPPATTPPVTRPPVVVVPPSNTTPVVIAPPATTPPATTPPATTPVRKPAGNPRAEKPSQESPH